MELKQSRSDFAGFKQWSAVQFGPAALSCSPTLHEGRVKFAERQAEDSDSQRRTGDGETLDVYQTYKSVCHDDTPSLFEPENSHLPARCVHVTWAKWETR